MQRMHVDMILDHFNQELSVLCACRRRIEFAWNSNLLLCAAFFPTLEVAITAEAPLLV